MANMYLSRLKQSGGGGLSVDSLTITTQPTNRNYAQYDSLDLTGLVVTAQFSDGVTADVTSAITTSPADGAELATSGTQTITIEYEGATVTTTVTVAAMTAIAVTTSPTKLNYAPNDYLDLTGLVITGTAGTLTRNVTADCTFNPADGTQLTTEGTITVDVSFHGLTTSFYINVVSRIFIKELPFNNDLGGAVVFQDEIHLIGSSISGNGTKHYKFDKNTLTWKNVSTLPYSYNRANPVVFDNKIHLIGGYENGTKHYAWDGSSWTNIETLPINMEFNTAVVYNNEIHVFINDNSTFKHYKWNGSSWTNVGTLPHNPSFAGVTVYDNKIHVIFTDSNNFMRYYYTYNGSSWTNVGEISVGGYSAGSRGGLVVFNNQLHVLGNNQHYKYTLSGWTTASTPLRTVQRAPIVAYNNEIYQLGSYTDHTFAAQWNGAEWTAASS